MRDRIGRIMTDDRTELFVGLLIVISVALVVFEIGMDAAHPQHRNVVLINDAFTIIFVIELTLRFIGERRPARFFGSYWIDIIALIPVMRGFRILRVLRLFRLVPVVGKIVSRDMNFLAERFKFVRLEYVLLSLGMFVAVLMGALSMRFAEGKTNTDVDSLGDALWFAFLTVIAGEPIGAEPTTEFGRVVTASLMLIGLTVFAIFTGTVSAVMVDSLKGIKLRSVNMEDLSNHTVICGWNRAGVLILKELLNGSTDHVVVITESEATEEHEVLQRYRHQVDHIHGDFTRVDTLMRARIKHASNAILLSDDSKEDRSLQDRDARTVLAAMLIERLHPDIHTTVQLHNRDNVTSLKTGGVEQVIVSDEYVGSIMATVVRNRGVISVLDELLTTQHGSQFYRAELPKPLVGMTVIEAMKWLKTERDSTLIAVDTCDEKRGLLVNPDADLRLEDSFEIITAGRKPL